jgi:hypothetical protein
LTPCLASSSWYIKAAINGTIINVDTEAAYLSITGELYPSDYRYRRYAIGWATTALSTKLPISKDFRINGGARNIFEDAIDKYFAEAGRFTYDSIWSWSSTYGNSSSGGSGGYGGGDYGGDYGGGDDNEWEW